jgi:hypothetical protein
VSDCLLVGPSPFKPRYGHLHFSVHCVQGQASHLGGRAAAEWNWAHASAAPTMELLQRYPAALYTFLMSSLDNSYVLPNIRIVIWTIWTGCFLRWRCCYWTDQYSQLFFLRHNIWSWHLHFSIATSEWNSSQIRLSGWQFCNMWIDYGLDSPGFESQ